MEKNSVLTHIITVFSKYSPCVDVKVLSELLNISEERHYKKGQLILRTGEPCNQVCYILSGVIRSYYLDVDGNDVTKNFYAEDSVMMEESLLGYTQNICTYEALEDCTVLLLNSTQVKALIMQNDYLKNLYLIGLENGIRYKIIRENEFLMQNATERYLNFCKRYPKLEKRVRQAYIASYLGITPESLSRIRRILREEK